MSGARSRGVTAGVLFAVALALNGYLDRIAAVAQPQHSLYLPSGKYLRWASLGFRGLLADAIYIWSIQYYSSERKDRWRWLVQTYDVITDLDPHFEAAYSIGALILSLEAARTDHALALLDKGIRLNPGRYLLAWEAAFYARSLHGQERMVKYLDIARRAGDAPSYVARWHAHILDRAGHREDSLRLWREAHDSARSDYEREVARRHMDAIQLEMQLEQLRAIVDGFRARSARWPASLDELVATGELAELPVDPAGRPLKYDPRDGSIRAVTGFLKSHRFQR